MKNKCLLLIIINLIVILPLLYLCFYTYPTSDDFSYGVSLINSGFIETNINRYLGWTSRYFATSVLITSPLAFGSINYFGIYPLIFIILFVIAFFVLFRSFGLDKDHSIILSVSSLSIYSLLLTSLSENFYWLAGSITYFFPSIIFVFYLVILKKSYMNIKPHYYLLSLLYLFIIGGCTEILVGFSFIITGLLLIIHYYKEKKINTIYLLNILFLLFIMVFIVFSPGNNQREGVTFSEIDIVDVLFMSVRKILIINLRYVVLLFSFVFSIIYFLNIKFKNVENFKYKLIALVIGMNVLIFLGSFVSIYGLKEYYPPRVENLLVFVSLIFIIVISILINSTFNCNKFFVFGMGIIGLGFYFILPKNEFQIQNNFILVYDDILSGKVIDYKNQILERDSILNECNSECFIYRIKNAPRSIMFKDIGDENHYINKSMSKFYNVNKIAPKE